MSQKKLKPSIWEGVQKAVAEKADAVGNWFSEIGKEDKAKIGEGLSRSIDKGKAEALRRGMEGG